MRRVRVTTDTEILNITSVCLNSCLSYPACAELYCHLWPAPLYHCFPHFLINGTIFERKKLLNIRCVFWFSLQRSSETSHSKKNSAGYYIITTVPVFMSSTRYSCQILTKPHFSWQIFRRSTNTKFRENRSSVSQVVPRWKHDEANNRFSQLCERA